MADWIKRLFASPSGQANALNVGGDVNAPVNLINLVLENGAQIEAPLDINWNTTQVRLDTPRLSCCIGARGSPSCSDAQPSWTS